MAGTPLYIRHGDVEFWHQRPKANRKLRTNLEAISGTVYELHMSATNDWHLAAIVYPAVGDPAVYIDGKNRSADLHGAPPNNPLVSGSFIGAGWDQDTTGNPVDIQLEALYSKPLSDGERAEFEAAVHDRWDW
jgi:hypothetical protein